MMKIARTTTSSSILPMTLNKRFMASALLTKFEASVEQLPMREAVRYTSIKNGKWTATELKVSFDMNFSIHLYACMWTLSCKPMKNLHFFLKSFFFFYFFCLLKYIFGFSHKNISHKINYTNFIFFIFWWINFITSARWAFY